MQPEGGSGTPQGLHTVESRRRFQRFRDRERRQCQRLLPLPAARCPGGSLCRNLQNTSAHRLFHFTPACGSGVWKGPVGWPPRGLQSDACRLKAFLGWVATWAPSRGGPFAGWPLGASRGRFPEASFCGGAVMLSRISQTP